MMTVSYQSGKDVAEMFGLYLNYRSHDQHEIIELMSKKSRNTQYNITILCITWLLRLSEVKYFDDRNEKSVMIAKKMAESCKFNGLSLRYSAKLHDFTLADVSHNDNKTVAEMMCEFLHYVTSCDEGKKEFEAFLTQLLREHKTVQQNISRFCFNWFMSLIKTNQDSNATHVKIAKRAMQFYAPLPFI